TPVYSLQHLGLEPTLTLSKSFGSFSALRCARSVRADPCLRTFGLGGSPPACQFKSDRRCGCWIVADDFAGPKQLCRFHVQTHVGHSVNIIKHRLCLLGRIFPLLPGAYRASIDDDGVDKVDAPHED